MTQPISILVLETDPQQQRQIEQLIDALQDKPAASLSLLYVETAAAALSALAKEDCTLMLIGLPSYQLVGEWLILLRRIRRQHPDIPVIALVRQREIGLGLQAVNLGALAYFPREQLTPTTLQQLIIHAAAQRETLQLAQDLGLLAQIALASFPAQVAVLDEAGCIISGNTAWEEEVAHTTDPLLAGMGPGDNLPDRCRQYELTAILSALQTILSGEKAKITLEYPLREGEKLVWYMLCLAPMQWPTGGVILTRLDITESIEHQIHVSTYDADLAALKSRVAEMTHELRTPLTSLRLHLDLLERLPPERRAQKEGHYLRVLHEQVNLMEQFVNDTLALMRLEQRSGSKNWSFVALNDLVQHVTDTQQPVAVAKGLTLTFTPGPLPLIQGDPRQLNQVIINLLANALRYTSMGSVSVSTGVDTENGRVFLRVADTGIGIAPENTPHIFEHFFRTARAQQTATTGTGLGLSIAHKIVVDHGGEITVSSELDVGSVFTVWLPVTKT